MNTQILAAPGDLFLGSDIKTALAQGARHFQSAAKAVRFAMEHAAPVSLHGALLTIGDRHFGPAEIRQLHRQMQHPSVPEARGLAGHRGRIRQRRTVKPPVQA